jgi:hypothetical protein
MVHNSQAFRIRPDRLASGAPDFDFFTSTETANSDVEVGNRKELENAVRSDEIAIALAEESFARIAGSKICHTVETIDEAEMMNQPQSRLEIADSIDKNPWRMA